MSPQPDTERPPEPGADWLVVLDAAHAAQFKAEAERDAAQARIAALEAENARLRGLAQAVIEKFDWQIAQEPVFEGARPGDHDNEEVAALRAALANAPGGAQ